MNSKIIYKKTINQFKRYFIIMTNEAGVIKHQNEG